MKLLITDIETLKKYVANITSFVKFEQLASEVQAATVEYMLPYLGDAFHDYLATLVAVPGSTPTETETTLIEKLQAALANYTALKYTPISDTFFTSQGLQTVKSEHQVGAFEYQKRDRMNKYAADADTLMDDALAYLEAHAANFPHYEASLTYSHWAFANATHFNQFYNIGNSRRTFLRLLPIIRRVETLELEPALKTNYESIQQTEDVRTLELVQHALANLTIARAVHELCFRVSADTVQIASFYEAGKNSGSVATLQAISDRAEKDGQAFLYRLRQKLDGTGGTPEVKNNADSKHFII